MDCKIMLYDIKEMMLIYSSLDEHFNYVWRKLFYENNYEKQRQVVLIKQIIKLLTNTNNNKAQLNSLRYQIIQKMLSNKSFINFAA